MTGKTAQGPVQYNEKLFMRTKRAIIIGAGPAGLTAALELLRQTDVQPIVLESSSEIGGISRTVH